MCVRWSPVATASYQMLPDVKLLQPFTGSDAQQLVSICPKKVFDIEDMGTKVQFCTKKKIQQISRPD